jgi:uncharacterized protein
MEKLPCEQVVWEALPAIRAAIAAEMVEKGLSQREVSHILKLAPSAVSQYLSGKRGYRIEFAPEVKQAIAELSADLRERRTEDPSPRICAICCLIRDIQSCGACDESPES